jgi:hypothetical protein
MRKAPCTIKPIGKRKATKNFTVVVIIPNRTEGKVTLKGTTGMAHLHGSER